MKGSYHETLLSARTAVPIAAEIESQFGAASHFITEYGFPKNGLNSWNTLVYFGGRYRLHMCVDVKVDLQGNTITQVGEPVFYFWEIESVQVDRLEGNDVPAIGWEVGFHTEFSAKEWKRVCEARGDFAAIGITINPNPVANFDVIVEDEQKRRVPVSLLAK
ncbi:hypothetical protein [Schlesneria paludicola]|uniref:hypothetical protein n=1 Tax=Schlesneria paludicola TaxID=360056 RepID=UPI000492A42D|nr:hypothetical protein [Schlesneria paludicola]